VSSAALGSCSRGMPAGWLAHAPTLLLLLLCCLRVLAFLVRRGRARTALWRCGLPERAWRPSLAWRPYAASRRNLLDRVRARCAQAPRGAYGVLLGSACVVHVGSPVLARAALALASHHKAPFYDAFKGFVGAGVFTADGEGWRAKRAAVMKAFAAAGTQPLEAAAREEAATLSEELLRELRGAEGSVSCDLLPQLQALSLRSTFRFLTSARLADARLEKAYVAAATTLRAVLPARARSLWAWLLPGPLYALLTPLGRAERTACKAAHLLAAHAVHRASSSSPLGEILEDMGCKRTSSDALHCAATLLFAGHDTQAATLAWCMLHLAEQEDVQERLGRCCEHAHAPPLLDAVLRETLRLHPPAPLVVRALHGAGGQCSLPDECGVAVWLHAVQRDASAWGADADSFTPDRWLTTDGGNGDTLRTLSDAQSAAYMPFACGPRLCPGAALATAALKVTLRHLVGCVRWVPGGGVPVDWHPSVGFTVTPAAGVPLRITRRA